MNNKAIKTFEDLLQEEQRLTAHLAQLKGTMQDDISGVKSGMKEKLNPIKKAREKVRNLFVRNDQNGPVLNFTLNFVLDYFIRLFIPNRTSVWTKTVVPFLTKNYVAHLITDEHRKTILKFVDDNLGKLDHMLRKPRTKKETPNYKTAAADPLTRPTHTVNTNPMGL